MRDSAAQFISSKISRAEFEAEVALEEIVNDLVKKVPGLIVKNIKINRQYDDMGEFYKVKIIAAKK